MGAVKLAPGAGPEVADWPDDARPLKVAEPDIVGARFADRVQDDAALLRRTFEAAENPAFGHRYHAVFGGLKVRFFARWAGEEGRALSRRAAALACSAFGWKAAGIVTSWANIYGRGASALAHAHPKCAASVVYMLDAGDQDRNERFAGRLAIVDPRVPACTPAEPGCLLAPLFPRMTPGSMILIPYQIVHCVTPYEGTRPRVTLAWDLVPMEPKAA